MLRIEAVEVGERGRQAQHVVLRQRERALVGMMLRAARKQLTRRVELDVRAENVTDRPLADERDEPLRARAVRVDLVDHQATRQQEVAGEQQRGPVVVEDQVSGLMAGRRDDFDRASAERDARDAFRPFRQAQRRAQVFDLGRHDLDSRQRCELRIACTMIAMPVRMQDQQRNLRPGFRWAPGP